MVKGLNWHGHAHCHTCEWTWDKAGTTECFDYEPAATKHERQTGHATTTRLHRMDFCEQMGCTQVDQFVR